VLNITTIMKIQVYSDLHFEYNSHDPPRLHKLNDVDLLVLAGDIGVIENKEFLKFIEYVSNTWKYIIFVPGNHEFYSDTEPISLLKLKFIKLFSKYTNIVYLDNNYWDYKGIRFIGSVLWSNPLHTRDRWDFKEIKDLSSDNEIIHLSVDAFKQMHQKCVKYLKDQIIEINEMVDNELINKVVVITHFPPIDEGTIHPNFKDSIYKTYFTNNLDSLDIDLTNIDLWISGHTHYSYDIQLEHKNNKCRFISNQLGYLTEKLETGFKYKEGSSIKI
jgi:predicted phosphohydrolase